MLATSAQQFGEEKPNIPFIKPSAMCSYQNGILVTGLFVFGTAKGRRNLVCLSHILLLIGKGDERSWVFTAHAVVKIDDIVVVLEGRSSPLQFGEVDGVADLVISADAVGRVVFSRLVCGGDR